MDKLLSEIPIYVLVPVALVLLGVVFFVVFKAFNEGREVSFWPPKIGPRTKSEDGNPRTTLVPNQTTLVNSSLVSNIPSVNLSANSIGILTIVSGPQVGRVFILTEEHRSVTVGRGPTCDISFPGSPFFSLNHFRIVITPTDSKDTLSRDYKIEIVDCGSANGTFVNGRRVTRQDLLNNDRFQAGETTIVFNRIDTSPRTTPGTHGAG